MPSIRKFFPGNSVSDWSAGQFGKAGWVPNEPDSVEGTVGDQSVALTWTAGRNNGADITGWYIEKNDGSWSDAVSNTGSATAAHTVTGLTNGQAYTFRIKGINSVGLSEVPSTASSSYSPLGAPLIPGTLSLAVGNPGHTAIDLSWSAGSANGATITGYKVQYSTDGSTWSTAVADTGSTATTYSVASLTQNTTYHARVAAINSVGLGTYSNVPTLLTESFSPVVATGGTISDYTNSADGFLYRSHIFTSSGTFTISANPDSLLFDVLVVGSGAGSGANFKNAAGGGEALATMGQAGTVESYTVTVGAGGSQSGNDSVFVSAPATSPALTGRKGIYAQPIPYGAGNSGNGNAGGNNSGSGGGGGGGGAGAAGTPGIYTPTGARVGGNGGAGLYNTPFQAGGAYYGGGGGGGSGNGTVSTVYGYGGSGGGGNGGRMGWSYNGLPISTVGAANTGGGGGGNGDNGGGQPGFMCTGGSGKVIIRYALQDTS